MNLEVVPIYGNGWFDVALQRPMTTPKPFAIDVIQDHASIIGRICTPGHEFEGRLAVLQRRYKDEPTNYDVEIVDPSAEGLIHGQGRVICNGYAVMTPPPRPAATE